MSVKTKKLPPNWRRRYEDYLRERERSEGTVRQYLRDVEHFFKQQKSDSAMPDSCRLQDWKEGLIEQGYAVSSINGMIAAVNGLLCCLGLEREKLKPLRQQRKIFCRKERQLSREEYLRLVNTALQKGDRRLALVLQTICSTGIRISELQYITVETLRHRRATVHNKGKIREILLPRQLCAELKGWAKAVHIRSGPVFVTRNGLPLDRSNVWSQMKGLCAAAQVDPSKVFPHNLRHLFARTFYRMEKDLSRLADLLGHSSIQTTRIYLMESGEEHQRMLERMRLLL